MTEQAYYAAPDAVCLDVAGPASARIYRACRVERTVLGERATIGDFSRVGDSVLGENALLQRDNLAYFLRLGRYSYTGRNTVSWHAEVGAFCSISWNVSIGGANHDFTRLTTHSFLYDEKDFGLMPEGAAGYDRFSEPCVIGSAVWIGAGACILRGVTVGTGAVIGAGAVVTRDIPPYTVAVGVPAKPVKQRFSDEVVCRLLDTAWWELPGEVIRANYPLFNAQPDGEGLTLLEDLCREFRRNCP